MNFLFRGNDGLLCRLAEMIVIQSLAVLRLFLLVIPAQAGIQMRE